MILSKLKTFQILRTLSSYIYIKIKVKNITPISFIKKKKKSLVYLFYNGITKILKIKYQKHVVGFVSVLIKCKFMHSVCI